MDSIVTIEHRASDLGEVIKQTQRFIQNSKSANTRIAYQTDWRHFCSWCDSHGLASLPATPQTIAAYISDLAENHKVSTIQRRLSSISQAHEAVEFENPTHTSIVRNTMKGIKRTLGTAPRQMTAAVIDDIRLMVRALPNNLLGVRDKALLLLGFSGAFRRSEIVGLDIEDLEFKSEGIIVHLRRSKTDQEASGMLKGIPYGRRLETCPVKAIETWLEASGIQSGPIFRGVDKHGNLLPNRLCPQAVAIIIKRAAHNAGLDEGKYAGHSLRSGAATTAASSGAEERKIMAMTGHKSVYMVRRYIHLGRLFQDSASSSLGL